MIGQWLQRLFRRSHRPAVPAGVTTPQPPPPADSDIHATDPVDDPLALFLPFQIRPLESTDLGELLGVFRQAIQISAANQYDQQQRDAWSRAQSHESLISALSEGEAVVAEWEDALVGFAHRVSGYINMVFVHPDASRVGIATLLYQHLEDGARVEGVTELTAHASLTAHDFFHFMGFTSEGQEDAERDGVRLPRHHMRKSLI